MRHKKIQQGEQGNLDLHCTLAYRSINTVHPGLYTIATIIRIISQNSLSEKEELEPV